VQLSLAYREGDTGTGRHIVTSTDGPSSPLAGARVAVAGTSEDLTDHEQSPVPVEPQAHPHAAGDARQKVAAATNH